jgi:hypothetical protein
MVSSMQLVRGRWWRYALVSVAALVVGLWCWSRRSSGSLEAQERRAASPWTPRSSASSDELPRSGSEAEDVLPEAIPATGLSDPAARAVAVAKLDETINLYRETMTYPLSSRPADASNAHLTDWNHSISTGQPFAVDAAKRELRADARIDRVFAAPGQAVTVSVTASYVDDGTPAALEEVDAELQWRDRQANEWVLIQAVALQAAGKGSWRGAVIPSQVEALRGPIREVRIMAYARVGEFARELSLDFSYALDQPVVVRGLVSERVVAGSLELDLDVELSSAAPIGLNATLFAADGTTPIAVYDDRYFAKGAGRQIITLTFFGKILHDRKVDGPYRLGAVHGYVYRQGQSPDQVFFDRADEPPMRTAAHPASGFSPEAYQSPDVAARIAHYEAIREAMRAGRVPPAPPPSLQGPTTR